MTMNEQDRVARGRFLMLTLIRLGGVLLLGFGLLVWITDLLRPGGWPAFGIALAVIGFVESILLPQLLAAKWRTPENQ